MAHCQHFTPRRFTRPPSQAQALRAGADLRRCFISVYLRGLAILLTFI